MVWTLCNTKPSWCVDETHKTMGNPASVEFSYQTTAALLLKVLARPTIVFVLSATLAEHMQMCMFCLILTRTGFDCFHGFIGGGGKGNKQR